jgi:hypothetical protein
MKVKTKLPLPELLGGTCGSAWFIGRVSRRD